MTNASKLFLAPAIIIVSSCGGLGEQNSKSIVFADVLCPKIFHSSSQNDPVTGAINSGEELRGILDNLEISGIEVPKIDFSKGTVALVYGGFSGTTNEWVTISGIAKSERGDVTVQYDEYSAGFPGCGGDTAISYSICIVQATAQFTEASFEFQTLNSCEATENLPE